VRVIGGAVADGLGGEDGQNACGDQGRVGVRHGGRQRICAHQRGGHDPGAARDQAQIAAPPPGPFVGFLGRFIEAAPPVEAVEGGEDGDGGGQDDNAQLRRAAQWGGPERRGHGQAGRDGHEGAQAHSQVIDLLGVCGGTGLDVGGHGKLPCRYDK
jgi:hypothetical protein